MLRFVAALTAVGIVLSGCAPAASPSSGAGLSPGIPALTKASTAPSISTTTAAASPVPAAGAWGATGHMITARAEHTATLLADGKVLVAGGIASNDESEVLDSAELYDPSTGSWSATGSMVTPRAQHTATLLPDGKVLVAGGHCDGRATKGCPAVEDPDGAMAAAELYDPSTGKWTVTGSMTTERFLHTATLLANGKVLVAGAEHAPDRILDTAELYDPNTGKWTVTDSMGTARTQQMASVLLDDKVLVAGGVGPISSTAHDLLVSAELYDLRTGKWTATGSLTTARAHGATATLLHDGHVIVIGGDGPGDPALASADLYDPNSGTWTPTGSMVTARDQFASTLLADGEVLVVGGFDVPGALDGLLASAELFGPTTGRWRDAGAMSVTRFAHTATLLASGSVLVTGGIIVAGDRPDPTSATSTAELYDPTGGP
jgi:N-acetylneuraminic acid mutarotase